LLWQRATQQLARASGQGPALALAQCPLPLLAGRSAHLRLPGPPTARTADAARRLSRTMAEPGMAQARPPDGCLLHVWEQKRGMATWLSQVKQARNVLRVFRSDHGQVGRLSRLLFCSAVCSLGRHQITDPGENSSCHPLFTSLPTHPSKFGMAHV
jgi:hypothetical protein